MVDRPLRFFESVRALDNVKRFSIVGTARLSVVEYSRILNHSIVENPTFFNQTGSLTVLEKIELQGSEYGE